MFLAQYVWKRVTPPGGEWGSTRLDSGRAAATRVMGDGLPDLGGTQERLIGLAQTRVT